ncbi:hypothetical protein ACQCT5_20520 [Sutcliffiella halmapala]
MSGGNDGLAGAGPCVMMCTGPWVGWEYFMVVWGREREGEVSVNLIDSFIN